MSNDSMPLSLLALRTSSQQLNELTDFVNGALREAERFLLECSIGFDYFVEVEGTPYEVGLFKLNEGWRLCIASPSEASEFPDICAWDKCSRNEKMGAASGLPKLIEALRAEVSSRLSEAEKAKLALAPILPAIGAVAPPKLDIRTDVQVIKGKK